MSNTTEFSTPEVTHKGQSLFAIKMGAQLSRSDMASKTVANTTRTYFTVNWEFFVTMKRLAGSGSRDTTTYNMKFVDPQDLLSFANGLLAAANEKPILALDRYHSNPDEKTKETNPWVLKDKLFIDSTDNSKLIDLMVKTSQSSDVMPCNNLRYVFPKREYYNAFRDTSKGNYGGNKKTKTLNISPMMRSENAEMAITDIFTKNMSHIVGISYFETEIAGASKEKTKRNIFIPMESTEAISFSQMISINYSQLNGMINTKISELRQ